jgi:Xaa-Pro aminopeptidase
MKKKLVFVLLIGLMVTSTALAARFDFPTCEPRFELIGCLTRMKITDDQKHAVAVTLRRHKAELKPIMQALMEAWSSLRQAMRSESPRKEDILASYQRLASSGEKFVLSAVNIIVEVKGILTPEQRRMLREGQERMDRAIARKIEWRRALLDEWIGVHAQ